MVLQGLKQTLRRSRRRHLRQDPGYAPPDDEIAIRVEQCVDEDSRDAGAKAFECTACGRHDLVPSQQLDQERNEIAVVRADLGGGCNDALYLAAAQIGGAPQK